MTSLTRAFGCWVLTAVAAAALAATPTFAQPIDESEFEMSLTYGRNQNPVSFAEPFAAGLGLAGLRDIRIDRRPDPQQNFGLNAAGTVWRHLLLFTEFIYNDLGEARLSARLAFSTRRATFTARMRFYEWTSGGRVLLPTGTWWVRPYIGAGAGTVWARISGEAEGVTGESETGRDITYHGDIGVRVFLSRQIGIAPEFRLVNIPDQTFYRVLVSAVFRFY